MPFCPDCRQEFEAGFTQCADCERELVSSLEGIDEVPETLPGTELIEGELRLFAESSDLATGILQMLGRAGVPVYQYDEPIRVDGREVVQLAVPADFEDGTFSQLRGLPYDEIEVGGAVSRLYVRPDLREGEEAPELFEHSDEELVARGASIHGELAKLALGAAPDYRARAIGILDQMGPDGQAVLWGIVREGIEGRKLDLVSDFLFWLRAIKLSPPEDETNALLSDSDPDVRRMGVLILGKLVGEGAGRRLVPMLADPDEGIRDETIELLFHLFGDDLGYDPEADEAEREQAIGRWRKKLG